MSTIEPSAPHTLAIHINGAIHHIQINGAIHPGDCLEAVRALRANPDISHIRRLLDAAAMTEQESS